MPMSPHFYTLANVATSAFIFGHRSCLRTLSSSLEAGRKGPADLQSLILFLVLNTSSSSSSNRTLHTNFILVEVLLGLAWVLPGSSNSS